jgi:hypothetical protein
MDDPYLDMIDEKWNNIEMIYNVFRDMRPIVEFDLDNKKIYAYPAHEYINSLSARTRNETKKQYEDACNSNQFMLFIKDEKNKKLRSYIFDVPE